MFSNLNRSLLKAFGEPVNTPVGRLTAIVDFQTLEGALDKKQKDYTKPCLGMDEIDAAKLKEGAKITVRNKNYIFVKALPDGGGMAVVSLTESGTGKAWYPEQ